MTQMARCVFCGEPSRIVLTRTSDEKTVPVCRQCVPRRKKLSWAVNPTDGVFQADRSLDETQKFRVTQ